MERQDRAEVGVVADAEGARRATGESAGGGEPGPRPVEPDPEVPEKARRGRFSGAYKLRILQAVEACSESGEVGALLRREGLYSSHLSKWRRQRDAGALEGLRPTLGLKRYGRIVQQAPLPLVEHAGLKPVLLSQIRDGHLV